MLRTKGEFIADTLLPGNDARKRRFYPLVQAAFPMLYGAALSDPLIFSWKDKALDMLKITGAAVGEVAKAGAAALGAFEIAYRTNNSLLALTFPALWYGGSILQNIAMAPFQRDDIL